MKRIDIGDVLIAVGAVLVVIGLCIVTGSCTTEEATRSARSIELVYGEGSGSFSSRGGWKTSDDVWRGGMGGDLDVHSWSIGWAPFAYLPDPDASATRTALERVLRARAEERPKWEAQSESTSPVAPVTPKPEDCGSSQDCSEAGAAPVDTPARPVLPLASIETLSDGRRIVLVDGRVALELDPLEPHRATPAPLEPPTDPPSQAAGQKWWQNAEFVASISAALIAILSVLTHRTVKHTRAKRKAKRAAVESAKTPAERARTAYDALPTEPFMWRERGFSSPAEARRAGEPQRCKPETLADPDDAHAPTT